MPCLSSKVSHPFTPCEHSRIHSWERHCACGECGQLFIRGASLLEQRQLHAGARPREDRGRQRALPGEAPRGRAGAHSASALYTRSPSDTSSCCSCTTGCTWAGKKTFECRDCCKAFGQKPNLTLHQQTHSDERPFACTECGKAFRRSSTLAARYRRHNGQRLAAQLPGLGEASQPACCPPGASASPRQAVLRRGQATWMQQAIRLGWRGRPSQSGSLPHPPARVATGVRRLEAH